MVENKLKCFHFSPACNKRPYQLNNVIQRIDGTKHGCWQLLYNAAKHVLAAIFTIFFAENLITVIYMTSTILKYYDENKYWKVLPQT
jgi:hypothetical protein